MHANPCYIENSVEKHDKTKLCSGQDKPVKQSVNSIFSTSFNSDYYFVGFSKSEMNMDMASNGRYQEVMFQDKVKI